MLAEKKKSGDAEDLRLQMYRVEKNMVRRAMAFIAEESRLLSRAMSLL